MTTGTVDQEAAAAALRAHYEKHEPDVTEKRPVSALKSGASVTHWRSPHQRVIDAIMAPTHR